MKKLFILVATIGLLYSCSSNQKQEAAQIAEDAVEVIESGDLHNARNSLDYLGTYTGELPAADCPGMKVVITLSDSTFTKTTEYIDRKDKPVEEKGKYVWNEQGNTITLEGVQAPNQYFVGENYLTQLDIEGNKITGDLADKYILRK